MKWPIRLRPRWVAAATALVAAAAAAVPVVSQAATSASVTLSGGSLAFINSTPATTLTFPSTTLNGTNQAVTTTLAFDVGDATGSGTGWNVTGTSTTFKSGSNALPTTSSTIQAAPTASCDSGAAGCTAATTNVTYPYTLPAATTAPTATKLFNATAASGMGDQSFTPTWTLTIPANAVASATPYTSTWTFSLVSGP